jgi:hypothetical protein
MCLSLFVESKVILFYIPAIGQAKIFHLFFIAYGIAFVVTIGILCVMNVIETEKTKPLSLKITNDLRAHLASRAEMKGKSLHYYAILALKRATGYKEPKETL